MDSVFGSEMPIKMYINVHANAADLHPMPGMGLRVGDLLVVSILSHTYNSHRCLTGVKSAEKYRASRTYKSPKQTRVLRLGA